MTLEKLKEHCEKTINPNGKLIFDTNSNVYKEHKLILDLIKEHEDRKWIPCSERLPELYQPVLVCYKTLSGIVQSESERFEGDRWSALCGMKPIAWMPLPEPYKESD